MLVTALFYRSQGLSVIPVGRNKVPLLVWTEFQKRIANEDEIKSWWKKWPDANVGVVTGAVSNITVVDIENGGDIAYLPPTARVRTGGGGYHYFYRYQEGIKNKARIKPLTDIRGEGGYVVAPPSIHQSGKRYEWLDSETIAPFPIHLFSEQVQDPFSRSPGQVQKRDWTVLEAGVGEGSRNETAAKVAGKLLRSIHPDEWDSVAWPAFSGWNLKNNPPLTEAELRSIFKSIGKRAIYDERRPISKGTKLSFSSETVIGTVKWNDALALGETELMATRQEDCLSYGYNFLDDLLTGIFPGELIVLGGATGTGKTTVAMNIVTRAAKAGHKVFVFALEDRLEDYAIRTLFYKINQIARREDDSIKDLYKWNLYRRNAYKDERFLGHMAKAKEELATENMTFIVVDGRLTFESLERMIEQEVKIGTELFLIDHLHHFDLDSSDMGRNEYIENFMVDLRNMQRRNRARVILIAHYRKLNGDAPGIDSFKDSSAIGQNASYIINLFRERGEALGGKRKKNETVTQSIMQFKNQVDERYINTFFMIPKARNPNGEGVLLVQYDKLAGDYIDIQPQEFKPIGDMEKKNVLPGISSAPTDRPIVVAQYDWTK